MTFRADSRLVAGVIPSPNYDARTSRIDILLMHYTGMQTAEEAVARLTDKEAGVSCHYFVHEGGRIDQLVPEARRAWHAGLSSWKGATDINARSIGIEVANPGHEFGYRDFPDAQIDALIKLCRDIVGRHPIRRERVLAHSDVAPMRKKDPGERFPWDRLAAQGIGLWLEPTPIDGGRTFSANDKGAEVEKLQKQLARFGYDLKITGRYDDNTRGVVTAFQRHFRPARVDGLADPSTVTTLQRLLRK
ncbi:MAG: N-acetylmuramoyl-L-alanine amidase [Alphaproteobacteria bacterium]|nr:MAG: N-acetylmuramoyl-L-alanine amidase [Alphaproteobacteria bacterium]